MLVGESIWSRGLFTPRPIAFADLLDALGRQLAAEHADILETPLPESLSRLVRQLSSAQNPPALGSTWGECAAPMSMVAPQRRALMHLPDPSRLRLPHSTEWHPESETAISRRNQAACRQSRSFSTLMSGWIHA